MYTDVSEKWGDLLNWVRSFPDSRLVEEMSLIESVFECDECIFDTILSDSLLDLREFLRDEIVRRFSLVHGVNMPV